MSQIRLEDVLKLLERFIEGEKHKLEIILLGGLALQYYGMQKRITVDLDAEVHGNLEGLFHFLKDNDLPTDLSEDISGWSVVSMPPGYRDRAITIHEKGSLVVRVLNPLDFIIAKLRRFTEEDIDDALYVAGKYGIKTLKVEQAAEEAIQDSVKDTALFLFRKNVQIFLDKLSTERN